MLRKKAGLARRGPSRSGNCLPSWSPALQPDSYIRQQTHPREERGWGLTGWPAPCTTKCVTILTAHPACEYVWDPTPTHYARCQEPPVDVFLQPHVQFAGKVGDYRLGLICCWAIGRRQQPAETQAAIMCQG